MELQFSKEVCSCLHSLVSQVQTQEQTQEVKLPEGMPDIGRVLGAWGQVLIRGKEWRSSGMTVSGGVLGWVLYAPEDGSEARMVDTWIPFQMKWDFPESQRDGTILVWPLLNSMDARCVSARKLLFRCVVSVLGEAMEPTSMELYSPAQVPEDVQLLKNTYPMVLPMEAGEKQYLIQEDLGSGEDCRILRYEVKLQLSEQRIMANRLVFRGMAILHMLCRDPEGKLLTRDMELPFSQYVELDGSYSDHATASIQLILTALEIERDEQEMMQIKCSVAAQYTIWDRMMVEAVEDAYSPRRKLEIEREVCKLPARLDSQRETVTVEADWKSDGKLLDAGFCCGHPQLQRNGDQVQIRVPGQFQLLYTDEEGLLQGTNVKAEAVWNAESEKSNQLRISWQSGFVSAEPGVDGFELRQELQTEMEACCEGGLNMVSGLQMGEPEEPDPSRPSLILRRAGGKRLWDIAKDSGSTVDAIQKANGITDEPETDRILLIPV